MSRFPLILLAGLVALGLGCDRNKKEGTTPTAPGPGEGADEAPGMDQRGGVDQPDVPGDDVAGEAPGDEPVAGGEPGTDEDTPGEEPPAEEIKPPNLDLPPEQQRRKVAEHLEQARAALRGEQKNTEAAVRAAKAALEADASSIDAVAVLALAYYHAGWHETAEQTLATVFDSTAPATRQRAREDADIYYVYGLLYQSRGDQARARLAFENAVERDSNHQSALINLGRIYLQNDLDAKAIPLYERLLNELGQKTALVYNNLGAAYRGRAHDFRNDANRRDQYLMRAEQAFKRSLSVDRDYGPAYYNLGVLYMDADGFPGANGQPMDELRRLKRAMTYFDEYRKMPGANIDKLDDRTKTLKRSIKRETRRREREQG